MAAFRFSRRAESDLTEITHYTLRKWGEDQTLRYIDELEDCCRNLATHPHLGRPCDVIRPGLRRMEHGRHAIFYRQETGGILITRILHQRMLPEKQAIDDESEQNPPAGPRRRKPR